MMLAEQIIHKPSIHTSYNPRITLHTKSQDRSDLSTTVKQQAGPKIISLITTLTIIRNDILCDICKEITRKCE